VDNGTTVLNGGLILGTSSHTPPSSSSDTGTKGEVRFDTDYIYICVNDNEWKRSSLSW
jgi:hypothetical protein